MMLQRSTNPVKFAEEQKILKFGEWKSVTILSVVMLIPVKNR